METAQFEQDQSGVVAAFVELIGQQGTPAEVAAAVKEALAHEKLFVFGELLDMEGVQGLQEDDPATYKLLEVFAYGGCAEAKAAGIELTPAQHAKLRLLTIVSLAQDEKVIPYATLLEQLGITEIRELEDTVIECIYVGLMTGKLDQKGQRLEVLTNVGRDVRDADISDMAAQLQKWASASTAVIAAIGDNTQMAIDAADAERQRKAELQQNVEEMKGLLKIEAEAAGVAAAQQAGSHKRR